MAPGLPPSRRPASWVEEMSSPRRDGEMNTLPLPSFPDCSFPGLSDSDVPSATSRNFGQSLTVTCDGNFAADPVGSEGAVVSCGLGGVWSGVFPSACEPDCTFSGLPDSSQLIATATPFGSSLNVACDAAFTADPLGTDAAPKTCNAGGAWSAAFPTTCQPGSYDISLSAPIQSSSCSHR